MRGQAEIQKTITKSAKVLIVRQSTIYLFSLISSVILARLLTPKVFGLYAIIGFFLQFLTLISDGGIGAGLIQRAGDPDKDTYSVAFTIIQALYLAACVIAVPGALLFTRIYESMSLNVWMIYTFILEFYLSSFRVVPAAKLERTLRYTRLAIVETLEYFSFQVVAVILAFLGEGVWSFIFGALVSRVVGLVVLYALAPFVPRLRFDLKVARPLMQFGIPLQLADMVGFIQSSLSPSFIAFKLGTAAVGFSNFARKVGSYPSYPLNVVNRMMFPLLSRLQDNEEDFSRTLNEMIRIYNIVLFGTTSILLGVVPETVRIVFGDKWMSSTRLIYSVLLGTLLLGYLSPISAAIQAKGRGKTFLLTNGLNALVSWAIAVPSVFLFGFNGLIALNISEIVTFPILLVIVRKQLKVRIWSNLWRPTCVLSATYACQRLLVQFVHPARLPGLAFCLLVGGGLYALFTLTLDRKSKEWVWVNVSILLRHLSRLRHSERPQT